MNKTQLEIIDIIKDYMDKSLSEGCYMSILDINPKTWKEDLEIIDKIVYIENWENEKPWDTFFSMKDNRYWLKEYILKDFEDWRIIPKIIGHYDITAVLKYINEKAIDISLIYNDLYTSHWNFRIELWKKRYWPKNKILPNKPLHLYTDQENDNLLKLLKELWNN